MAKSEKLIATHAEQKALAQRVFNTEYKDYIAKELVEELKISYLTKQSIYDVWQKTFAYDREIELFLLWKTHMFIILLSDTNETTDRNFKSPTFLKNFIGLVSEYLSPYICKKGIDPNVCRQQIRQTLLKDDIYTKLAMKKYANMIDEEYALQQRALHSKHKRKHLIKPQPTERQTLKTNIIKAKKILGKPERAPYTAEEEARYKAQIAKVKARKAFERCNAITIEVSMYIEGLHR